MRKLALICFISLIPAGSSGGRRSARCGRAEIAVPSIATGRRSQPGPSFRSGRRDPSTAANIAVGRTFPATVAQNVMDPAGRVVIPGGSPATLIVRGLKQGGTFHRDKMMLALDSVEVQGRRYVAGSEDVRLEGTPGIGKNRRTAKMVGGGAGAGTVVGLLGGGGTGAIIGAFAGAAAGAGAQVLTQGKEIRVPAETVLYFRLDQPMHLREVKLTWPTYTRCGSRSWPWTASRSAS